jgi:hypothetical protein
MLTNLFLGDRWIHTGYKDGILLRNHSVTASAVTITVAACNGSKITYPSRKKKISKRNKDICASTGSGLPFYLNLQVQGERFDRIAVRSLVNSRSS